MASDRTRIVSEVECLVCKRSFILKIDSLCYSCLDLPFFIFFVQLDSIDPALFWQCGVERRCISGVIQANERLSHQGSTRDCSFQKSHLRLVPNVRPYSSPCGNIVLPSFSAGISQLGIKVFCFMTAAIGLDFRISHSLKALLSLIILCVIKDVTFNARSQFPSSLLFILAGSIFCFKYFFFS